jgi:hypothetical protein
VVAANATALREKRDRGDGKLVASGALPAGLRQKLVHERWFCPCAEAVGQRQSGQRALPLLRAIGPRRQPGPFLERAVEGRGFGEAELFGDVLDGQLVAAEVVDGEVAAQVVLEFLEAGAFFAQVAAQGLRADMQLLGDPFQVRPLLAVAAEQAADLAGQAVAAVGAGQQVGGGVFEELLERAFVLQQRHGQVAGVEQQAGGACAEAPGAGKQQFVLGGVLRLGVGEGGFLQADALADQPAAEAVPDYQQAFHQEVVGVPQAAVVHAQPRPVAFALQADARCIGEQAVEQRAAAQRFFQRAAVDDGVAHHGEGAAFARLAAEAQVLVVQRFPQQLHQPGELLGGDARTRLDEHRRLNAGLAQQRLAGQTPTLRAAQGGADEMAGDGAFAHVGLP